MGDELPDGAITVLALPKDARDGLAGQATVSVPPWGTIRGARITTRIAMSPGVTLTIMIHEFGHILGLEHDDDPASVMYPSLQRAPGTIEVADLGYVRTQLRGCD
jgi:hypothetical protein